MSEENKLLTVYQKLGQTFGINATNYAASSPEQTPDKELIRANSQAELNTKTLEFKQDFFLQQQYNKIVEDSDMKSLEAVTLRLPAIIDYVMMDNYPLFGQALNLLAEEACTIGEKGKMLTVYSDNKALKEDLEALFYDKLDINTTLPFWVRNMCKYGDNFCYILTDRNRGIIDVRQLPVAEIERKEKVDKQTSKIKTTFYWTAKNQEYTMWQVSHMRLLGDDRWLPYGTSVLAPVRIFWRMLKMSEDAMLIYRAARASERRVIKVNVGNADPSDIPMMIQNAASKFKRATLIDQATGNINYKFNPATVEQDIFIAVRSDNATSPIETLAGACLDLNTSIELLDGRSLTLNEIIGEHNSGKQLWTYSINPTSGEIVPGKITWAGVTRKNTDVVKITLDNGETITCTPDHKIPTKFNGVKEAQDLSVGESLWAFNKEQKEENLDYKDIVSIEFLEEKMDTGTITVDGFEEFHNYHNFALTCGVFVNNSNLNDIADIAYLRDQIFTGLGIPKIFLGYSSDSSGEGGGKNLAQIDVRFARKVNRIQQAALQELNKMAMIHLLLLGYDEEEIRNFKLTLTNPSTQSDMLKIEHWLQKIDLYAKLTTPNEQGIKPMSDTRAKREVLDMSDDEIIEDLKQQLMEKVVASELENSVNKIKSSKIFNDLYKYYEAGIINPDTEENGPTGNAEAGGETLGAMAGEATPPEGETAGTETPTPETGATPAAPGNLQESFIRKHKKINAELEDMINGLKDEDLD